MAKIVNSSARSFPKLKKNQIQLIASGDLRLSANQVCWPAQRQMEEALGAAIEAEAAKSFAPIPARLTSNTASSPRNAKVSRYSRTLTRQRH